MQFLHGLRNVALILEIVVGGIEYLGSASPVKIKTYKTTIQRVFPVVNNKVEKHFPTRIISVSSELPHPVAIIITST